MMCNNIIFSEYPTCRDIYINMLHAFTHTIKVDNNPI